MMNYTDIAWCDKTWNPISGCTKCSPGCENCYAEKMARKRFAGRFGYPADDPFRPGVFRPDRLDEPGKLKRPSRIFVSSMGDLFHAAVPDWMIFAVWEALSQCDQHRFMFLTKRAGRMRDWFAKLDDTGPLGIGPVLWRDGKHAFDVTNEECERVIRSGRGTMFHDWVDSWGDPPEGYSAPTYDWAEGPRWWRTFPNNLWVGVTVCNQEEADEKIPLLLSIPAAVRFVSIEPILGPVALTKFIGMISYEPRIRGLDWVIAGAETGRKARPANLDWLRSLRHQCYQSETPFFLKQIDARNVDLLDGHGDKQYPKQQKLWNEMRGGK